MAKRRSYRQAYGSGECGLCAIVSAVDTVCRSVDEDAAGELLSALAQALPAETVADLARTVYEEGTERPEMEVMIPAAQRWTRARGWPDWQWESAHPHWGETAEHFWDRLSAVPRRPHTAVIIGFGEDTVPESRYGGHWTCIERITQRMIYVCDSDVYRRIPRSDTGIRPEPRWSIEDCFILSRVT
jgi:hypothetical protein